MSASHGSVQVNIAKRANPKKGTAKETNNYPKEAFKSKEENQTETELNTQPFRFYLLAVFSALALVAFAFSSSFCTSSSLSSSCQRVVFEENRVVKY